MYKAEHHDIYCNSKLNSYITPLIAEIKSLGSKFMGEIYDNNNHNTLINYWFEHNAAAIYNFKYGEKINSDIITTRMLNEISLNINDCIFTNPNASISYIKDATYKKLAKSDKVYPPYLINACKNILESKITTEFVKKISEMITEIKNNTQKDSSFIGKLDRAADSVAGWFNISYDNYEEENKQIWDDIHAEYKKQFKSLISQYASIYCNRRKIVIYIVSAHNSTQDGKNTPCLQIFEYKWSRLFGDLLQSALVKMGFTAIKVIPESNEFGYKVKNDGNNNFITTRPLGSEAPGISKMPADLAVRGNRVATMQKYFGNPRCITYLTHLNAGVYEKGDLYYYKSKASSYDNVNENTDGSYLIRTLRGINQCDILAYHLLKIAKEEYKLYLHDMNMITEYGDNVENTNQYIGHNYADSEINNIIKNDIQSNPNIPLVLTENLFQDIHKDITYLRSCKGIRELMGIHILGMFKYFTQETTIKLTYKNSAFKSTPSTGVGNTSIIISGDQLVQISDKTKNAYDSFKAEMESVFDTITITNYRYNTKGNTTKLNNNYTVNNVIASIVGASLTPGTYTLIPSNIDHIVLKGDAYYKEKRTPYNAIIK